MAGLGARLRTANKLQLGTKRAAKSRCLPTMSGCILGSAAKLAPSSSSSSLALAPSRRQPEHLVGRLSGLQLDDWCRRWLAAFALHFNVLHCQPLSAVCLLARSLACLSTLLQRLHHDEIGLARACSPVSHRSSHTPLLSAQVVDTQVATGRAVWR